MKVIVASLMLAAVAYAAPAPSFEIGFAKGFPRPTTSTTTTTTTPGTIPEGSTKPPGKYYVPVFFKQDKTTSTTTTTTVAPGPDVEKTTRPYYPYYPWNGWFYVIKNTQTVDTTGTGATGGGATGGATDTGSTDTAATYSDNNGMKILSPLYQIRKSTPAPAPAAGAPAAPADTPAATPKPAKQYFLPLFSYNKQSDETTTMAPMTTDGPMTTTQGGVQYLLQFGH